MTDLYNLEQALKEEDGVTASDREYFEAFNTATPEGASKESAKKISKGRSTTDAILDTSAQQLAMHAMPLQMPEEKSEAVESEAPATTLAPAATPVTPATPVAPGTEPTAEQLKAGSWGKMGDLNGVDLGNVDAVTEMARRGGWADPKAFSLDMLDMSTVSDNQYGDNLAASGSGKFKSEFAAARGNGGGDFTVKYGESQDVSQTDGDGNIPVTDKPPSKPPITGYQVKAGAVDGEKRRTTLYYNYDKDGKFSGTDVDVETTFLDDVKPFLGMALTFLGVPPIAGIFAPTLGTVGANILAGGLVNGTTTAAMGGKFGKGFVSGAIGAGVGEAVSAFNPASGLGIKNPQLIKAVNGGISRVATSALTGGKMKDALIGSIVSGGVNYANPGAGFGLNPQNAAKFNNMASAGLSSALTKNNVRSSVINAALSPVRRNM